MDLDREGKQYLIALARYKFCVNLPLRACPEVQKTKASAAFFRARTVSQFFKALSAERLERAGLCFFQRLFQDRSLLRIHRVCRRDHSDIQAIQRERKHACCGMLLKVLDDLNCTAKCAFS